MVNQESCAQESSDEINSSKTNIGWQDWDLKTQSGMENNDSHTGATAGSSVHENVKFSDQIDPYSYAMDSTMDPTRKLQDTNDAALENFFSRPIKIATYDWIVSGNLIADIDPWSLYFDNPRVSNRISNFNLMRCDLKIKVVINGNGFHYGRAITYYEPFDVFDTLTLSLADPASIVQASQMPHIYLDPTTSLGGEMTLPFFWYLNYLKIPTSDWSALGKLRLRSINPLKHANGAADNVTVSIFAWAENVSLSVLTSVDVDTMIPQSGNETDEVNSKGVISGPATAVAKFAATMTGVPYIGPFAMATEMAATTTAAIAKLFGYSRPTVTKNPEPYRPTPASSLALTNVGDGAQKLTLDDKQELTIDPRIAGLGGGDPLNIRSIASRESYLTSFTWATGVGPESLLWNARVDPCTWAVNSTPPIGYHFPACAMAAMPFQYWTGTMKFRFQIVCSAFHKGRLKVVYDPNYFASTEYNTNYLNIVDIADKTDFTIEVGNGQNKTLLNCARPGINSVTELYSTTPYIAPEFFGNGVIGIYVVNELTTPNSTVNNDIEVNVFVSMGDDFEVFVPDDHFQSFVFKPQSGREMLVSESQNTTEPSAPLQMSADSLGPKWTDTSLVNKVFTGEAISSFRSVLHRYNLWTSLGLLTTGEAYVSGRFNMFPYLRGNVAGAVQQTAAAAPYNYCNTVMLHWVTYAFSGWRGSIRYKLLPRGGYNERNHMTMYVQRSHLFGVAYARNEGLMPGYANSTDAAKAIMYRETFLPTPEQPFTGVLGAAYGRSEVNPILEFEVPYYSNNRFTPGKTEDLTGLNVFNECFDYFIQGNGSNDLVYDIHVATGEDFQTFFFTGLPRMYYEPLPPA